MNKPYLNNAYYNYRASGQLTTPLSKFTSPLINNFVGKLCLVDIVDK